MLKAALYLAGLYLVYRMFLSRDTHYSRNRVFILTSSAASMLLPLFTIPGLRPIELDQVFGVSLSDILITENAELTDSVNQSSQQSGFAKILLIVYFSGMAAVILKLLAEILHLIWLILKHKHNSGKIVFFKGLETAGFSALGYIFINQKLAGSEAEEIIKHEKNHLNRYHFLDIILIEIVKALQWFNPFVYLFERSLREIHEYQADEGCLSTGIHPLSYQTLLLSQVFRSNALRIPDSFSYPSLIKKRMIMMTKERTGSLANLKVLLVVPVVISVMLFISACDKRSNGILLESPTSPSSLSATETPKPGNENVDAYAVVEEMPIFPGGDAALLRYIAENTTYPAEAKEKGIQGRVIIRFTVNADGTVGNLSVLKGVDPLLDSEALRVVNSLPSFTPGRQGGVPVAVWYMVPITFSLNTDNKTENVPPPPPPPPAEYRIQEGTNASVTVVMENKKVSEEPFVVVEGMPVFPGGDQALLKYIAENVLYPEAAKVKGIQGRVIVRFCITETGKIDRVSVLKGVDPDLDAEALRVVSTLPDFQPGRQGGKPVAVWYMVPITFALN